MSKIIHLASFQNYQCMYIDSTFIWKVSRPGSKSPIRKVVCTTRCFSTFRHERNHLATKIEITCLKLSILLIELLVLEKVKEVGLIISRKKAQGYAYFISFAH